MKFKSKICNWCSLEYVPTHTAQKYCCVSCGYKGRRDAYLRRTYDKATLQRAMDYL